MTRMPKGAVQFIRKSAHQRWESEYIIPMDMIQKQFTTAFWNTEIKARRAAALQLPRGEGKAFLGLRNLNPDRDPTVEDRWSHDSIFERYAGSDRFILPDQKFSKGTQLYDNLFTKPAESAPNFVMGGVYEHYLHETMVSIKYFDENGNQTSGPSGYTPYLSPETRAYPPVFTTKRHLIDKTKTRTLTLDGTYYGG